MKGRSTEELKRAVAAVFLGEGLERMSEEQMLSAVSMKRRWFSPEKAKILIENGRKAGILGSDGKYLFPLFQYRDMDIPFGYYPPESVIEYAGENMLERIKSEWKLSEDEVRGALSMEYNLEDEVKVLLWGARNGKKYSHLIEGVEKELIEKYKSKI